MKTFRFSTLLYLLAILSATLACVRTDSATARLHDIFDREWQTRLEENPFQATSVGVHDYNDRLPSVAPEYLERRDGVWRGYLAELDAIDRDALSEVDHINLDMLRAQLANRIAGYEFGSYQIPFNADVGE